MATATITTTNMEESTTFWEQTASAQWGSYISEVEERFIRQAHGVFERPSRALEVGADGGRWSRLLADLGWQMTCTDVDAETLAVCQERIPESTCIQVDIDSQELPCDTESTELVLCIEVNEVLESDWFIAESNRVLASGGVLVGVFQIFLGYFLERQKTVPVCTIVDKHRLETWLDASYLGLINI